MNHYIVQLELNAQEIMSYYEGRAAAVRARAHTGAIVQFPAAVLRPFVTKDGVRGQFRLSVGANGRFAGLQRLPR